MTSLSDSEYKVLEILWERGDTSAKELSHRLKEATGWSKTTTYTIIKRSVDKGLIQRIEPNFICHALVSKSDTQNQETSELIDRLYDGSPKKLMSFLVEKNTFTKKEIDDFKKMIDDLDE